MSAPTIESLIGTWDGESVVVHHDKPSGAWIFIGIHSTRLGPAGGGTRMKHYATPVEGLADVLKLSSAMTKKFAVPAIPYGGGKAVICLPKSFDVEKRPGLLRRYGALIKQLGGLYQTGPDVGTSEFDMDLIDEVASPFVFGKSAAKGGNGNSGAITAAGVFAGIEVACEQIYGSSSLAGRSVVVQGIGSVGGALIQQLRKAGATVMFHDVDAAAIAKLKSEDPSVKLLSAEAIYDTPCDVFAPCALGGILDSNTIARLRCKAVVGAANNQLADDAAASRLHDRGILFAPDYVVNVGGAMGLLGMGLRGWSPEQAEREVTASVHKALRDVFSTAKAAGCNTMDAADALAKRNLA